MKQGYPVAERGGISQQRYEQKTGMQRRGIQTMLKTAGVRMDGPMRIVDLGCRNGDTTLGLLEAAPKEAHVIGVEEFSQALTLARFKFGLHNDADERDLLKLVGDILQFTGSNFYEFRDTAKPMLGRVDFVHSMMDELLSVVSGADLVAGFQLLHWLDNDSNDLPKGEILKSIAHIMVPGGTFISGTSTAFVGIDPNGMIDGMTKAEYSIDEHPFFKEVYARIEAAVKMMPGHAPMPVSAGAQLKLDALVGLMESCGFTDVQTGAFLVTPGREEVISEVVKIRPKHQGRLEGIPEVKAAEIIARAIAETNEHFDSADSRDPRQRVMNIWDAVPYVKATRSDKDVK
ncbi:TPA: hypothetical protein EYP38_02000 [Candidatus Micrarchaeota archaeon]|nr:hypothetical protein [Candidatus Micrarchaeota archaeon]